MRFVFDMRIGMPHPLAGWVLLLFFSWAGAAAQTAFAAPEATPPPREYEIKAAFIYNFTKFIEWPARSFPDAQSPFVIGVLGETPCAEALEQLVKDRKFNGRTIIVRRIAEAQALGRLQILFVGSAQDVEFGTLLPTIAADPILTVGESTAFASMGGAINFVRQDDKVRFEVNLHSAGQSGVKISAQLLKLATVVREAP